MTATNKKQGACFPIDLWQEVKREAESTGTTMSKIIVQAVREMVERKNTMFPNEKILITNILPNFKHAGPMRFRIQAVNINPEGVSKADISDLIKIGRAHV